jgi:YVTN family beta-propeller protein
MAVAVNSVTNKIYVANSAGFNVAGNVAVIEGATNSTTSVTVGIEPIAVAVNPVTNKIYVANSESGNVTVMDGATKTTTTVPGGIGPNAVAVNPVTNKIYVSNFDTANGTSNVMVLTEEPVQTIPLTTTIGPLPGNQTNDPTPTFTFTAASTFSPTAPKPDAVYFQVDTWQGAWTSAAPTAPGAATFTGTLSTLLPGVHVVYAYATDGQDATSTQGGGGASSIGAGSPLIGNITAYVFLVTAPTTEGLQSHVASVNLPRGLKNSLTAKLSSARASFRSNNIPAACGQLGAFINEVIAQSGKPILITDSDELIGTANLIRRIVGCS